jgi:hypothetical protein
MGLFNGLEYEVGESVAVTMTSNGRPLFGRVAVNKDRTIFGFVDTFRPEFISYFSYGLDYFIPAKIMEGSELTELFYFDFGNKFGLTYAELEKAFKALKLL